MLQHCPRSRLAKTLFQTNSEASNNLIRSGKYTIFNNVINGGISMAATHRNTSCNEDKVFRKGRSSGNKKSEKYCFLVESVHVQYSNNAAVSTPLITDFSEPYFQTYSEETK